jgi:Mg/Co/Ni transporter MgtE
MSYDDRKKLRKLAKLEDCESVIKLLEKAVRDSVVPGMCVNPGCDFTAYVEPDQWAAWCDDCNTPTVKSCLVLADVI